MCIFILFSEDSETGAGCSVDVRLVFDWCSVGVRLVFAWCSVGVQLVLGWCLVGAGGSWGLLGAPGGSWGLLGAPGGSWRLVEAPGALLGAPGVLGVGLGKGR